MRFYFRYILIFLIINYKWILVESTGSSATPPASSGGATDSSNKTGVELSLKATAATNEFDYKKDGNVVTFTPKDNYAFKSVKTGKNGDIVVWSTTNASEYANKVVLNGKGKKEKKVTIYFPNNTTKVYKRDGKGKPWTTVSQQSNQPTVQSTGSVTPASGSSQPVSGSSQSASEGTNGHGASLSQSNEGTRGGTTQSLGNEGSGTHTSSGGGSQASSGGKSADGSGGGSTHTSGGGGGGLGTQAGQPNVTETSNLTPVSVNIYCEDGNNHFENKFENNVRTFTSKDKYAFNCTFDFFFGAKVEFWKTKNEKEYAKKVVVEGDTKVTIHIGEGDSNKKVFMRVGKNEQWIEFVESKVNPRSVNITHDKETYFYKYELKDKNVRTFEAKEKFAFNNVKDGTTDIWKTENESEHAKKIVVDGNKVTIHIGEGDSNKKIFKKEDDGTWTDTAAGNKKVVLSLKAKKATDLFDYYKAGQVVTYTAKDKNGFKSVKSGKNGDIVVWKTDKETEYATKVVLNGKGKNKKTVTIHLPNNTTKVFKRDGKGKPWNEVSQQSNQVNGQPGSGTPASGSSQSGGKSA